MPVCVVRACRGVGALGGGGGGWHKASASDCLPLAAPISLSPLLILTLCGSERVLVVSTEPLDDLSCLGGGGGHAGSHLWEVRGPRAVSLGALWRAHGGAVCPCAGREVVIVCHRVGGCVCLVLRAPAAGQGSPSPRPLWESWIG